MPTGRQIRAARALVDWDAAKLADKAGVRRETILAIENGLSQPRTSTIDSIVQVFHDNGVEFRGNNGVELQDDRVQEINGNGCYAKLLDDIYNQVRSGEEILVGMVSESISPNDVHDTYKRIISKGIRYRKLIKEGDSHIRGPLSWYRHINQKYYQNSASVFYLDKSAYLTADFQKVIIVRDRAITKANKNLFEMVWSHAIPAQESTANEKYQ